MSIKETTEKILYAKLFLITLDEFPKYIKGNFDREKIEEILQDFLKQAIKTTQKEERQRIIELAGEIIKEEHYSGTFYVLNKLIKNLK